MRRLGLIAAAALAGVVVLGSLWWILQSVLRLEDAERNARVHAAHEERVRLALWRMDSSLATFLAFENARPVDSPSGIRVAEPPFVSRRFEVSADLPPVATTPDPSVPRAGQLLALLRQPSLYRHAAAVLPSAAVPRPAPPPSVEVPSIEVSAEERLPATVADQALAPAPLNAAEQNQAALNSLEFAQRNRVAGQQAVFMTVEPSEVQSRPEIESARDPVADEGVPATIEHRAGEETNPTPRSATEENPTVPAAVSAPVRRSGPTGVVRTYEPLWFGSSLLLVRRIARDGDEALQALELLDKATHDWLLEQVKDLLPGGSLESVRETDPADPGRQLALLPLRLVAGPPPVAAEAAMSSARIGVLLAMSSILVVALAASCLVVAGLRLARRRSDFASAVIHELRTPLTTFRLYTDMLAEGAVPASEQPRYLQTLRRESDRLGRLVENVLAYAGLESRRPKAEPLNLASWLEVFGRQLEERTRLEDLSLEVTIAADAGEAFVAAEPLALERILHNLCDNSCKYAANGEILELAVTVRSRRAVFVWRDHGPGIPRNDRLRLLRPFQRGTLATSKPQEVDGIGLGLALCQQLSRRLGGQLRLLDPDGKGLAIELSLPLVAEPG